MRYLPYGQQINPTIEQIEKEKYKFQQYEYYGIPYGLFDDSNNGEGHRTQKEKDRDTAMFLITKEKSIPSDLEARLLQYKKQEEMMLKHKNKN